MKRKPVRYDPENDYYLTLGVPASASLGDLQRAFRQRAKEVHPDRNPDRPAWAAEQFRALSDAYNLLSDATARAVYDRQRRKFYPDAPIWQDNYWTRAHVSPDEAAPVPDFSEAFRSYSAPGYFAVYRMAFRNLMRGPYRLVVYALAIVLVANLVFITVTLYQREVEAFQASQPTNQPTATPTLTVTPSPPVP